MSLFTVAFPGMEMLICLSSTLVTVNSLPLIVLNVSTPSSMLEKNSVNAHLRLDSAAGVTKSINLTTNLAALIVFLFHGQVVILLGILAGLFNMIGNYLGSHSFTKNGGAIARPITIAVLLIFFVKVVWDFMA